MIFDDEDFDGSREMNASDSIAETDENIQIDRDIDLSSSFIAAERPKSLSVGGARLISLEEAQNRQNKIEFIDINKSIPINTPSASNSYIEVGGGPSSLPDKYHTVLPVPRSWQKRKTHSWKSLFTRGQPNANSNKLKDINAAASVSAKNTQRSNSATNESKSEIEKAQQQITRGSQKKMNKSVEIYNDGKPMEIYARSTSADSLRTSGHSRSVSHDSYFDLLQSPLRAAAAISPSREFSELGLNFDREEPEMRIFSESESLVSSPRVPKEVSTFIVSLEYSFPKMFFFCFVDAITTCDTVQNGRLFKRCKQRESQSEKATTPQHTECKRHPVEHKQSKSNDGRWQSA